VEESATGRCQILFLGKRGSQAGKNVGSAFKGAEKKKDKEMDRGGKKKERDDLGRCRFRTKKPVSGTPKEVKNKKKEEEQGYNLRRSRG